MALRPGFAVVVEHTVLVQARNVITAATMNDMPDRVGMRKSNRILSRVVDTSEDVDSCFTEYHAMAVRMAAQAIETVRKSPTRAVNVVLVAPSPK